MLQAPHGPEAEFAPARRHVRPVRLVAVMPPLLAPTLWVPVRGRIRDPSDSHGTEAADLHRIRACGRLLGLRHPTEAGRARSQIGSKPAPQTPSLQKARGSRA